VSTQGTDKSVDRFIAGEDRLAGLLRALPAYEPSVAMAARFAALARVAQNAYVPASSIATAASAPMMFEAPASLEASFLTEAARIQAAQQPIHDAVIKQIQAGKPVAEVLGRDVTEATAAWLASRPQRIAAQAEPQTQKRVVSKWWHRFGVVMASAVFGVVATNLWLAQRHNAPLATAMNEAPVAAPAVPASPPRVELKVEPIAQISAVTKAAPPPMESKRAVAEKLRTYAEAQRAMKDETASGMLESAAADKAEREQTLDQARDRRREEVATARQAPANDAGMSPPPAAGAAAERRAYAPRAAAPASAAEPTVAAAQKPVPAAPAALSRARADRASAVLQITLNSTPQEAAGAWQEISREHAPRISAANPESEAVRAWVERFRQALPADVRPAQIRIEQDGRLHEDALRLE